jgi:cobaltochelatase CobT
MKTIADDPELTVSFGNEVPALSGNKAKLPQVTNQFTPKDIAITRGLSDSFALRLSNHSDQIHSKYRPEGKNARAVFEAVEQARIEALGAIAMPGMAQNLNAALEDRFAKAVVNRSSNRKDTPLEEAVALMVRERLTGQAPPANAKMYVDLWRPWIEEKAARRLSNLGNAFRSDGIRQGLARYHRRPRHGR